MTEVTEKRTEDRYAIGDRSASFTNRQPDEPIMTSSPLVSVVVPTHRRPALLQRAVDSVLGQTYENWELVVSDDEGEAGETWSYLLDMAEDDERIRPVRNEGDHGQVGNTNNALRHSRGTWIKLLHDDDVLKPNCLAAMVELAEHVAKRFAVACVTCAAERYVDGEVVGSRRRRGWPTIEVIPQEDIHATMYMVEDVGGAAPSQKMIHRRVLDQGVYMEEPPGLHMLVDSWFNARIGSCGDLVLFRRPLVEWHQGDHTSVTEEWAENVDGEFFLLRDLLWKLVPNKEDLPPPRVMKQMVAIQRAVWRFRRGQPWYALRLLSDVRGGRAVAEYIRWVGHNVTRGQIATNRRIRLRMPATRSIGRIRIAVLFSRLSGYMAACLEAVKERYDVELLIVRVPPADAAPYSERYFTQLGELVDRTQVNRDELLQRVRSFAPDAILMSGWFDRDYLSVARTLRRDGVSVIAGSDAQWTGSVRQYFGRLAAPWYLHSAIDVLWVAGERQRQFARRLGFKGARCWEGVYACDRARFLNRASLDKKPSSFLYVGRYVHAKGIDTLLEAYDQYRQSVERPWDLTCVGTGDMGHMLEDRPGVVDRGFVQPDELPAVMSDASAFVLASRHEPWGVVVQEAAAAGLPLLCSEACGAAVHLLQDGYNGFLVQRDDVQHLATCMRRMSGMSNEELHEMGHRSELLSQQYTPERWAETLMKGIKKLHAER